MLQREISNSELGASRRAMLRRTLMRGMKKVLLECATELDDATRLGAYYVTDAFAGRLEHGMAKMSQQPPLIFAAFRLQTSDVWLGFVLACNFLHALLIFAEEPNGAAFAGGGGYLPAPPGPCRLLELVLILVYVTDVALKASYMGWAKYFSKPWQKLFAVVVGILFLDAATLSPVRLTRPLRPAVLCLRSRSVRRFFTVVQNMVPGFLRVCLPLVFFLLLSSSFGAMAFGSEEGPLSSPGTAGYNLWILTVSGETYQTLLHWASADATAGSVTPLYYGFFFVTLVVGHIFLLGLLLGITFDVFIAHTKAQVKSERLKELKGLTKAFAVMDTAGSGKLSRIAWNKFLEHLMPHLTRQERLMYFEIGSGFADDIDAIAFLDLRQVLDYRFVSSDQLRAAGQARALGGFCATLAGAAGRLKARKWFRRALAAAVTLDCALLPWGAPNANPPRAVLALEVMCSAMVLLDVLCAVAVAGTRLAVWRWFTRLSDHERVAAAAILLHAAANAVLHGPLLPVLCIVFGGYMPALVASRGAVAKVVYTLRLLRCWRLVTLNATLHKYVSTFFHILPAFLQTLSFALIIAYFFAVSAMDAFGGRVTRFKTPGDALLTMIQLFFGVDFQAVVEETMKGAGSASGAALAFFMVYHVLGVLIVFNLNNAIIIQFYSETLNERSMQREEEQRGVDDKLQEALLEHIRKQRYVDIWKDKVVQGAPKLSLTRRKPNVTGKELRRVLGVGSQGESLSEEDLRQCQKYARGDVNLLAAFKERREGEKSLLEFERNFYQQVKGSRQAPARCFTGGEVIFEAGQLHNCCYFVQRGRVLLTDRDGNRKIKDVGGMFGEVSLLGEVPQPVTARAISGTEQCECLVVSRVAFEERYNDVSRMGHLALWIRRARSLDAGSYGGSIAGTPAAETPRQNDHGDAEAAAAAALADATATAQRQAAAAAAAAAVAAGDYAAAATAAAAAAAAVNASATPTAAAAATPAAVAMAAGAFTAFAKAAPVGRGLYVAANGGSGSNCGGTSGGGSGAGSGSSSRGIGGGGSSGAGSKGAGSSNGCGSSIIGGDGSSTGSNGAGCSNGRGSSRSNRSNGSDRTNGDGASATESHLFAVPAARSSISSGDSSIVNDGSNGNGGSDRAKGSSGARNGAPAESGTFAMAASRLGNRGKRPASAMNNPQDGRLGAVSFVTTAVASFSTAGSSVTASLKGGCNGSVGAESSNCLTAGSGSSSAAGAGTGSGAVASGSNGAADCSGSNGLMAGSSGATAGSNGVPACSGSNGAPADCSSVAEGSMERSVDRSTNGHGYGNGSESASGNGSGSGANAATAAAVAAAVPPQTANGGLDGGDGRRRSKRRAPGPAEGDAAAPALVAGSGSGRTGGVAATTRGGDGSKKRRL